MDARAHLQIDGLTESKLVRQQSPLGVDDGEIVDQTGPVLNLGKAQIILRRRDRLPKITDLVGECVQVGQCVLDVAKCNEYLIQVGGNYLPILRLARLETGSQAAAFENRRRDSFGDRPEAALPREHTVERAALEPGSAR